MNIDASGKSQSICAPSQDAATMEGCGRCSHPLCNMRLIKGAVCCAVDDTAPYVDASAAANIHTPPGLSPGFDAAGLDRVAIIVVMVQVVLSMVGLGMALTEGVREWCSLMALATFPLVPLVWTLTLPQGRTGVLRVCVVVWVFTLSGRGWSGLLAEAAQVFLGWAWWAGALASLSDQQSL